MNASILHHVKPLVIADVNVVPVVGSNASSVPGALPSPIRPRHSFPVDAPIPDALAPHDVLHIQRPVVVHDPFSDWLASLNLDLRSC